MTKAIMATTLLAALLCVLAGCALGGPPNRGPTSAHTDADAASAGTAISPVPEDVSASSDDTALDMSEPWAPPVSLAHAEKPPDDRSPEEMTLLSGAIARVRLLDVEEMALHPGLDGNAYSIKMVFKFKMLEWLKGGNGEEIVRGGVGLDHADGDTLEEARWKAAYYFDNRDSQFDDREAILMFQDVPPGEDNTYSIGCLCLGNVGSPWALWLPETCPRCPATLLGSPWARWLPLASSSEVSGSSDGQRFLWRTSLNLYSGSDAARQSDENTISLNTLRRLAALSDDELKERIRILMGSVAMNHSPPAEMDISNLVAFSNTHAHSGDKWVALIWEYLGTPDSGVEGYRVLRRKQSDSQFIELADMRVDSDMFYEDALDIQPETEYIYILRAYGKDGDIADARVAITTDAALKPLDAPTATPTAVPTATPIHTAVAIPAPASSPAPTATPSPTAVAIIPPSPTPSPAVIIRGTPFAAEIADTPALRTKGLGYRDQLAPNSGMLFVFPNGQASSFWMRGMRFPLDFVWIGADCRVAALTERVPHPEPGAPDATLPLINPAAPAAYTFEINAGEIERFGIEIGDPVRFQGISPDAANSPDAAYPCDCRETEDCDDQR